MSYRNPQIIVDRSAEIWAQAATKFGETLATGLDNYFKAKKEAAEKKKKIDDAKQLYRNKSLLQQRKQINESASKIKDPGLMEQYKTNAINMLTTGEEYTINGKKYNISAIDAQTELAINPDLSADDRAAYTEIALSASQYQTNILEKTGAVIANLEPLKESGVYQIGSKIDIAGEGKDEYKNLVASNALLNQKPEGVTTKKNLLRRKNEDGSYSNIVSVDASFDIKSDIWKKLKDAYGLTDEDANFTWERDVDKWAGEGDLVVKLDETVGTDSVLEESGYIDKNHNQTGKGYLSNKIMTKTISQGREVVTTESHFDVDLMRNDPTYSAGLSGKAANILALPSQEAVIKYINNNLGWGGTITAENFYGPKVNEATRKEFLEQQLFENDLEKMFGAPGTSIGAKGSRGNRPATASDAQQYNSDPDIAKAIEEGRTRPLEVGDTIYFRIDRITDTAEKTPPGETSTEEKLEQFDQSVIDLTKQLSSGVINKLNQGQALTQNDVVPMLSRLAKIENAEGEVLKLQPLRPDLTAGGADTGAGYYTVQTNIMETLPDGTQRRVSNASRLGSQEAIEKVNQLKEQNPESKYTYMPYLVVNYKTPNPKYASSSSKRGVPRFIFTDDVYNLNSREDMNNLRLNIGRAYKSPTQERQAVTKYDQYKVK